ncbi:MAG: hypothetical protein JW825_04585, partial [Candidatus Methanofastidiosa archaeon]|nr:hypothetical protein [Candidatus Methanofastidiosa archaeon]
MDGQGKVVSLFRQLRRELDKLTTFQLVLILVVFFFFLIWPLISIIGGAFWDGGFTTKYISSVFSDPELWRLPGQWE